MPKTKLQGVVFGFLMSVTMAYGMEVYNVALKEGGLSWMTNRVFRDALLEAAYMWLLVFLFSNLWGNRLGHALAERICREEDVDNVLKEAFATPSPVVVDCMIGNDENVLPMIKPGQTYDTIMTEWEDKA